MIVSAAVKLNNKVYSLTKPNRHGDIIRMMAKEGITDFQNYVMGFLTDKNKFLTRKQAAKHAYRYKQINKKLSGLLSEDLW